MLGDKRLQGFHNWRSLLVNWIKPLTAKSTGTQVNRSSDEEKVDRRSNRSPAFKPGASVLEKVNVQKDAIKKLFDSGDLDKAAQFIEDLCAFQSQSSSNEHLSKTLCDLAQHAKGLELHELQLRLAQRDRKSTRLNSSHG